MAAPEPAGVVAYGSMLVRDPFMGLAHERFAPEPAEEAALEAHHGHPMTIDEPEDDGASDSGGDTSGSDWGTRKSGVSIVHVSRPLPP